MAATGGGMSALLLYGDDGVDLFVERGGCRCGCCWLCFVLAVLGRWFLCCLYSDVWYVDPGPPQARLFY